MKTAIHGLESPVERRHSSACELTILMPCLNEAETIGICVEKAMGFLRRRRVDGEVLVADNGSVDDSRAIAERCGARVVSAPSRGYGAALMKGIAAARGQYVIMGDADDSYDFAALDSFLGKLREGYDLVMGNRFRGGITSGAMPWLHRYLGNPVLSWIGRLFFESPVGDFHCGLRGFRRAAIRGLGLSTTGMEFASEMVVKATLRRLRITEVPTTLSVDGRTREPHMRRWRDGWRNLRFLLAFSPRWLFLYPGMILLVVGLASMVWLLPGPRRIGAVGFDVNTLLYGGAAIICGSQAIVFAVFSKIFAINSGLLPEDERIRRLVNAPSLELGILSGLVLIVCGLLASAYAVGLWGSASFGPLDTRISLRVVIPAVTALILGVQIVMSSFFMSVLGLRRG